MNSMYYTQQTIDILNTAHGLPAILIGGPPCAGKSVLTYNLTLELRRRDIPHYVFRANPDMEGDWFLQQELNNIRSITPTFKEHRAKWDKEFIDFVCHDLALRRHLPLIVDLGGKPQSDERCIFRACTHSILLLKEDEPELSQRWRDYTRDNDLSPIAEVTSRLEGISTLSARKPVIKGTITGLVRGMQHIPGPVFKAIADSVAKLFSSYSKEELEKLHRETAPVEHFVHVEERLQAIDPRREEWEYDGLQQFLAELSPQTPMAVYGRGPNWLYGALAVHAGTAPFHQFDARLGWIPTPVIQLATTTKLPEQLLHSSPVPYQDDEQYVLDMYPLHHYIDYTEAGTLAFPLPPSGRGVIVSGKLPLWLFTALARFYVQCDVPWIALTDAGSNVAVVIYSRVEKYSPGAAIRMPV